jgi:hypothetical protein
MQQRLFNAISECNATIKDTIRCDGFGQKFKEALIEKRIHITDYWLN